MLIVGTFKHCIELEEALVDLEKQGVSPKHILAVPMDSNLDDTMIYTGAYSKGIEIGMVCATSFSVIGTSVGFSLKWGPIIWGLTAAFIGFIIGFGLYSIFTHNKRRNISYRVPEVTIIVQCSEDVSATVKKIMWRSNALSIGGISHLE